jgi:hypothetical protein
LQEGFLMDRFRRVRKSVMVRSPRIFGTCGDCAKGEGQPFCPFAPSERYTKVWHASSRIHQSLPSRETVRSLQAVMDGNIKAKYVQYNILRTSYSYGLSVSG